MKRKVYCPNMEHEILVGNIAELFRMYIAATNVQKFYLIHKSFRGTASDVSCLPCYPVS